MNASDRCDRCGAQAYVRVMFKTGDLLFCGHHFDRYNPAFPPEHMVMDDERGSLLVSVSA